MGERRLTEKVQEFSFIIFSLLWFLCCGEVQVNRWGSRWLGE